MILAEKIMSLRKQSGWSQEELAEKLDVSRQSVSKWESATSIPDIEKILKMSELFDVSTDYLLKDSKEETEISTTTEEVKNTESGNRVITLEFATEYMDKIKCVSKKIATAVSICVLSPIVLILLAGMSETTDYHITEELAAGIGFCVLLVMVAAAVLVFVLEGMRISKYDFLEKETLSLQYGVEAVVNRRKESFEQAYRLSVAVGVIMCILAVIPLVCAGAFGASDFICILCVCFLLVIVSAAVFLFVSNGMVYGSYQKLLQEADYSPMEKAFSKKESPFFGAYWCIATAVYLGWSFMYNNWEISWVVWPVAGVLFVPYIAIVRAIAKTNR